MKDYILFLINRIISLVNSPGLSIPDIPYRDHRLDTSYECDLALTAYALGWRDGIEAAQKATYLLGSGADIKDIEDELSNLSIHPWPEYPEYGWKSESKSSSSSITLGEPSDSEYSSLPPQIVPSMLIERYDGVHSSFTASDESLRIIRISSADVPSYSSTYPSSDFTLPPNLHELDSGLPKFLITKSLDYTGDTGVVVPPLDCKGISLDSHTGKADSRISPPPISPVSSISPASSGSDPWTGADDIAEGYPV